MKFFVLKYYKDSELSYGENPKSLFHLGLDRYRDMTPKRTDGQTDTKTELP